MKQVVAHFFKFWAGVISIYFGIMLAAYTIGHFIDFN